MTHLVSKLKLFISKVPHLSSNFSNEIYRDMASLELIKKEFDDKGSFVEHAA